VAAFRLEEFRRRLRTRVIGRPCYYYPVLASTNTTARTLGQQGAAEGTIVVADAQTAGRGQAGRVWISPAERNLYVSVLLRPALAAAHAPLLSLTTAVALVDALREVGVASGIKWPNDILVARRKVAGILTEMEACGEAVRFAVVGIGVNVNMAPAELESLLGAIAAAATSLQIALGREIDREGLLATLLEAFERWYALLSEGRVAALQAAWEARSLMHGRRISVHTPEASWHGTASGIDAAGRLLVRRDDGALLRLTSADVRLLD
jgi:BirA family biotin operon repressor/biotin-[acetyl-CoA-carboxylase] ligase